MLPRAPRFRHVLTRGARYGMRTALRSEGMAASLGSLFGVLFFVQIVLLLALGVHAQLLLLQEKTDVRLEVLAMAELPAEERRTRVASFIHELQRQPYIDEVFYVTSAQASERMERRDPEFVAILRSLNIEDAFPETIGVRLHALEDYQRLAAFLQRPQFVGTVDPNFLRTSEQEYRLRSVYRATFAARSFLFAIVGLLGVVLVFVLVELVRRRAILRREEILIQQLVGATPLSIMVPFGFEVLILLSFALAFALLAVGGAVFAAPLLVPSLSVDGVFGPWVREMRYLISTLFPWIVLGEALLLPVFALLGSFFGLWPRLKRPTLSMSR